MIPALSDSIQVRSHYHRSVQLPHDWHEHRYLEAYLLTPMAHDLAMRIVQELQKAKGERAWSITGPYGTGKSAFAVFLTELLSRETPVHPDAQKLRDELGIAYRPFFPVLIMGQRSALTPVILSSLAGCIQSIAPDTARKIQMAARDASITDADVIELVQEAELAVESSGYGGLLFILDEFGKFLEFASMHPEEGDLLVMQHLAELSVRNRTPMLLITILHTAFADYLNVSNETQRIEWRKVQGRFVDVPFQEPPEQLLRLIGAAIEHTMPEQVEIAYMRAIHEIIETPPLEEARRRFPLNDLLPDCIPLHPFTALLLWPLFRSKLAQNERSLFSFLTSGEPHGFQTYLSSAPPDTDRPDFYRIDRLYDYAAATLGSAVYLGEHAHRWSEFHHALDRLRMDAPPLAASVLKTIGLLGLYGAPVGLCPSKEIINIALGDEGGTAGALDYLERASIVIYRRHEDAYGLWEGSDVDLDACLNQAKHAVERTDPVERLKKAVSLRPVVARAHYIRSGTLRYFAVDVVSGTEEALGKALKQEVAPADGRIIYVLTQAEQDRQALMAFAREQTEKATGIDRLRILAFPRVIAGLADALPDEEHWRWVRENTPALEGDGAARKEVQARLLHATERLHQVAGPVFGLQGYAFDPAASEWIQGGSEYTFGRASRAFQKWLSNLCDDVFDRSPALLNELINRDRLSTAAAKARRNLMEAMLNHEHEVQLGFEGTPPEVSMYRTLLVEGGFHRRRDGAWRFGDPDTRWRPVWDALHGFLKSTHRGRRPVQDLVRLLRKPPFGFREGPIPVLLCALLIVHRHDVALYEDGVFVPELRIEVLERLMRGRDTFEIQQYVLEAEDQKTFTALGNILEALDLPPDRQAAPNVLQVAKPLVLFAAQLPRFTQRTKRLDPPEAVAVREAIIRASDPYTLLFEELPQALGEPLGKEGALQPYIERLKDCLIALQRAYPQLLDTIEAQLRKTFDLHGTAKEAKQQLSKRAALLNGCASERTLALFIREAAQVGGRDWREVLARVVAGGTPPHQWHDRDAVTFQVRLQQVVSDFVRLEELVAEQKRTGASRVLRIGMLDGRLQESREIIAVTPERAGAVDALTERLTDVLDSNAGDDEETRRVRLAALAQAAARYLQPNGKANHE